MSLSMNTQAHSSSHVENRNKTSTKLQLFFGSAFPTEDLLAAKLSKAELSKPGFQFLLSHSSLAFIHTCSQTPLVWVSRD